MAALAESKKIAEQDERTRRGIPKQPESDESLEDLFIGATQKSKPTAPKTLDLLKTQKTQKSVAESRGSPEPIDSLPSTHAYVIF